MIIGTDTRQRYLKKQAQKEELYKLMVPHEVFAWLPKSLGNGQYVWLQKVWRFAGNFSVLDNMPSYYYALTYEEALAASKSYNNSYSKFSDAGVAAQEYLRVGF